MPCPWKNERMSDGGWGKFDLIALNSVKNWPRAGVIRCDVEIDDDARSKAEWRESISYMRIKSVQDVHYIKGHQPLYIYHTYHQNWFIHKDPQTMDKSPASSPSIPQLRIYQHFLISTTKTNLLDLVSSIVYLSHQPVQQQLDRFANEPENEKRFVQLTDPWSARYIHLCMCLNASICNPALIILAAGRHYMYWQGGTICTGSQGSTICTGSRAALYVLALRAALYVLAAGWHYMYICRSSAMFRTILGAYMHTYLVEFIR